MLLTVLWDGVVHTSPQVRNTTAQMFQVSPTSYKSTHTTSLSHSFLTELLHIFTVLSKLSQSFCFLQSCLGLPQPFQKVVPHFHCSFTIIVSLFHSFLTVLSHSPVFQQVSYSCSSLTLLHFSQLSLSLPQFSHFSLPHFSDLTLYNFHFPHTSSSPTLFHNFQTISVLPQF